MRPIPAPSATLPRPAGRCGSPPPSSTASSMAAWPKNGKSSTSSACTSSSRSRRQLKHSNRMNMDDQATEKPSWWQRLSGGLKRTSASVGGAIADLVVKRKLDQAMLDEIEEVLIRADLGIDVAARIAAAVGEGRYDKAISPDDVKAVVAAEVEKVLAPVAKPLAIGESKPFVVLVVGVNGSGKTTTIGKLAARLHAEGRS